MKATKELLEWKKAAFELVSEEYRKGPVKFWLFFALAFLYGLFAFLSKR